MSLSVNVALRTFPTPIAAAQADISIDELRKKAESLRNSESQKKASKVFQLFTWTMRDCLNSAVNSFNVKNKIDIPQRSLGQSFTLGDFRAFVKRGDATPDELLNFHLDRDLNTKIVETDEDIPVLYLINWGKMKMPHSTHICLDGEVSLRELAKYLKKVTTPVEQLNCMLGYTKKELRTRFYNGAKHLPNKFKINLEIRRDIFTCPTKEEVAKYFGSTAPEIDHYNVLRNTLRTTPMTREDLINYLGRQPTWQESLNCDKMRAFNHPISLNELYESLGRAPRLYERMNWHLGYDLNHTPTFDDLRQYLQAEPTPEQTFNWIENKDLNEVVTSDDEDIHDWRADVNRTLKIDQEPIDENNPSLKKGIHWPISLENFGKRLINPSCKEHLNCNLGRPLSHPIIKAELENYLGRLPTITEQINCREGKRLSFGREETPHGHFRKLFEKEVPDDLSGLATYVGNEEFIEKEVVNWDKNRDLSTEITNEELGSYIDKPASEVTREMWSVYNKNRESYL